jgi:predicted KAP-like P-loop ATPase
MSHSPSAFGILITVWKLTGLYTLIDMELLGLNIRFLSGSWPLQLGRFLEEEWSKIPLGILAGALLLGLERLTFNDAAFHSFVVKLWQNSSIKNDSGGFDHYHIELYTIATVLVLLAIKRWAPLIARVLNSWTEGVVSGLTATWGLSFFYNFCFEHLSLGRKLVGTIALGSAFSLLSAVFRFSAISRTSKKPTLPAAPRTEARPIVYEHLRYLEDDSPIENASQDLLSRSALVDSLARTILVLQAPVIALEGEYGDGKSSVLNLLRERLEGHAVVVSFKTWLPGSENTLVKDLFSDISAECRRAYYVPQLRSRLLHYAKTISGSISSLKGLSDVFPATSQREEIEEVRETLLRIPRRIVVLLDEMDRLQADELRILLKVVRGVTSFSNLCYVCAFSRAAIKKIYPKDSLESLEGYFEKFFPFSYALPKPEADFLLTVLKVRLEGVFDSLDWFDAQEDKKKFDKRLTDAWEDVLSKLVTNLRKTTLIVNDVSTAAAPISREVNSFDLVLIEALRRFFPEVYDQVRRNAGAFVETEATWSSRFASEEQFKLARKTLFADLIKNVQSDGDSKPAADLLWWMFPAFADQYGQGVASWQRKGLSRDSNQAEREKRIFHEDFFPIYFRYQAPESMYSETEMRKFILAMNESTSMEAQKDLFTRTLGLLPTGDRRRYSFLHRLLQSIGRLSDSAAETLAYAVAEHASEYVYDVLLPSVAEAGRGMLIVFEVAQRFARSSKVQEILEGSIARASADTFALRLLTFLVNPARNKILTDFSNVRADGLRKVFAQRMRERYVEGLDKVEPSLSKADRDAFVVWCQTSEEERQAEITFWRRFVGTSRKRFARMCDILFPQNSLWEGDPRPHIGQLFPLDELMRMDSELSNSETLEQFEVQAVRRMRKLVAGQFQHGVRPEDLVDTDEGSPQASG